ncbi:SCO family protein [Peribacillus sp. SCS-155]|uniref:SCO family protein n=1 Tax=Peribacillus sedimenti TaxID=3115297 RepID=UPI0039063786
MRSTFIFFAFLILFSLLLIQVLPEKDTLPVLKTIAPFEMSNVHDQQSYRFKEGKIRLVTFFYTNCPDVCPSTMNDLKTVQEEIKKHDLFGSEIQLISISIDPEVDDAETIRNYAAAFKADPSGWIWLRGSLQETKTAADMFQMNYTKNEDGFIAHSTTMYLVDKKNRIRAVYDMANSSKRVAFESIFHDMKSLVE